MWSSMREATDLQWHEDECIMTSFKFKSIPSELGITYSAK